MRDDVALALNTAATPASPPATQNGHRRRSVAIANTLNVPGKPSAAVTWMQEQLDQRRYCGLRTPDDVAAFVETTCGVAKPAAGVFRNESIRPKLFVSVTDADLAALGITGSADRQRILQEGATLTKNGQADVEKFLRALLTYQFQLMMAAFYGTVSNDSHPETIVSTQFDAFVESLEWYKKGYAGGKKELTAFQIKILYVDFLKLKRLQVESGVLVNVSTVAKALVAGAMEDPDAVRLYTLLGLSAPKLTETVELAGQNVVKAMKPFVLRLFDGYVGTLQKDIDSQSITRSPDTPATCKVLLRRIGDDAALAAVGVECDDVALRVIYKDTEDLGKTLRESVSPTMPDIYVSGRTV
jgi:hypothetical protein